MKILLWFAAILFGTFGWLTYLTTRPDSARSPVPAVTVATSSRPAPRILGAARASTTGPELVAAAAHDEPEISIGSQRARLEDRFAAERPDATWATTAQQELHADLGRFATRDVGIRDIQCRASLCRIELALATRDSASTFMESWLHKRTWTGPGVADNDVVGTDGHPQMVLFVGKDDGRDLF